MRLAWIARAALAASAVLAACGDDDDDDNGTGPEPTETAEVRFIHGATGRGDLDLAVDGGVIITGIALGEVSDYAEAAAGVQQLQARTAGTANGVTVGTTVLAEDKRHSAIASPENSLPNAPLIMSVFRDEIGTPAAGKARLRLAYTQGSTQDVYLVPDGTPVNTGADTPMMPSAIRGQTVAQDVDPGTYEVYVGPPDGAVAVLVDRVTVAAGESRTAFILDAPGSVGFLIVADD